MSAIANVRRAGVQRKVRLRPGALEDAERCGRICFAAFTAMATERGIASDIPTLEAGIGLATMLLAHPGFVSVVAEAEDGIVGCAFLDGRAGVAGLWPVAVDPAAQGAGLGLRLVREALGQADARGAMGVRVVQPACGSRLLGGLVELGFDVREVVACLNGPAIGVSVPGCEVRKAVEEDRAVCSLVCREVYGYDRDGELRDAIAAGSALVVERGGLVSGYVTSSGLLGHAVGRTTADVMALIGAARSFDGPGILVPMRNGALLRWCLEHGLRVVSSLVLMSRGCYEEPAGSYLPSVFG